MSESLQLLGIHFVHIPELHAPNESFASDSKKILRFVQNLKFQRDVAYEIDAHSLSWAPQSQN